MSRYFDSSAVHVTPSFRWTRALRAAAIGLAAILYLVAPSAAQTPDKGVIGYGADIGVQFPDEAFESTLAFDAHGEFYLTPRVAVRGLFGFASPGANLRTEDKLRQVQLLFSGIYNWEHKNWRPFVLGGAGAYFVRLLIDGGVDLPRETRGGIHFGGGSEYIFSDENALKVELRWDVVSHPPALPDASNATLTVGYKRYF
jgi:hypothetical protein